MIGGEILNPFSFVVCANLRIITKIMTKIMIIKRDRERITKMITRIVIIIIK